MVTNLLVRVNIYDQLTASILCQLGGIEECVSQ